MKDFLKLNHRQTLTSVLKRQSQPISRMILLFVSYSSGAVEKRSFSSAGNNAPSWLCKINYSVINVTLNNVSYAEFGI
jgi:hypothetical protein